MKNLISVKHKIVDSARQNILDGDSRLPFKLFAIYFLFFPNYSRKVFINLENYKKITYKRHFYFIYFFICDQ